MDIYDFLEIASGKPKRLVKPPTQWSTDKGPELIGLNETEMWILMEQLNSHSCGVTDADHYEEKYIHCEDPNVIHTKEFWIGTVITSGGDHYRMKAHKIGASPEFEIGQFVQVEKLS